jgi:hypothetical protein
VAAPWLRLVVGGLVYEAEGNGGGEGQEKEGEENGDVHLGWE